MSKTENTFQNSSEFKFKKCIITKGDGSDPRSLLNADMVLGFSVLENLFHPHLQASLALSDSGGLINSYPIEGGENIELEVGTSYQDEPIRYKFKIFKIANRVKKNKMQSYTLFMCSEESFVNEVIRLQKQLSGKPDQIVAELLRNELKSSKEFFVEPTKFSVKLLPGKRRPYDVIADMTKRSISEKAVYTNKKTSSKKTYEKNRDNRPNANVEKDIKGTAGYFFWETRRGFNFYSVDALCSVPKVNKEGQYIEGSEDFPAPNLLSKPWGPYRDVIANTDDGQDQRGLISSLKMSSEVDIMNGLRQGKYASVNIFFNISTGQYEEYVYKISSSYDHMAHLGGQDSISFIPTNQEELSQTPSRVLSAILDHEAWFNDPDIADPDSEATDNPNEFADWQKYYASQSTARYELLNNQQAEFQIPGNPLISAGDKVSILITNPLADKEKIEEPFDEETSGVYLVREVSHLYSLGEGGNGNITTSLRLFRDSYGMGELASTHGE